MIKVFAKALKMAFETKVTEIQYSPESIKQILVADKSAKKGCATRLKDFKNI